MSVGGSPLPDISALTVGVLGGTGDQGRGLAYRLARSGMSVRIGSRDPDRGRSMAAQLAATLAAVAGGRAPGGGVVGGSNLEACGCDLVIVAVPWPGHGELLRSLERPLAGKIVIDCVNPLGFDAKGPYPLPVPEGSAAQQAAAILPDSRVCAAFHHVSAVLLADPNVAEIDLDVLVLGDDREAVELVRALAGRISGMRGIYGGRLRNAHQVEALTANLIAVNRRYRAHAAIRITGV